MDRVGAAAFALGCEY